MHIISETTVQQFVERVPAAEKAMRAWVALTRRAHWRTPHDVRATFPATDFLAGGVVAFDVGGNKYRVSATLLYVNQHSRVGRVYVRRVMTHTEYDVHTSRGSL